MADMGGLIPALLDNYDLGRVREVYLLPHHSSSLAKVRMEDGRWFFVKGEHGPSASTLRKYAVENYVAQAGFPTPRTHKNKQDELLTKVGVIDFVVSDYLAGVEGPWRQPLHQRDQAARLLARLHALLRNLPALEGEAEQADLYTEFVQAAAGFRRMAEAVGRLNAPGNEVELFIRQHAETIHGHAEQVLGQLARAHHAALPKTLTHGDYAPVNHLVSGVDNRAGDVMAIIDFKPVMDLRARDCVEVFKEPRVAFARRRPVARLCLRGLEKLGLRSEETTRAKLVRFVAIYQNAAEHTGFPLTAAELALVPAMFRMARLRMLFWLTREKKKLERELAQGQRHFFILFEVLLQELNEDFGVALAPVAWDDFPGLVQQEQKRLRTGVR